MRLNDWMSAQGRGALTRMMRETSLSYSTVMDAVYERRSIRYDTAKLIASCTNGEVSPEEICDPPKRPLASPPGKPGKRRKRRSA